MGKTGGDFMRKELGRNGRNEKKKRNYEGQVERRWKAIMEILREVEKRKWRREMNEEVTMMKRK